MKFLKSISYASGENPRLRDRISGDDGRVGTVVDVTNYAGEAQEIMVRWDDGVIEFRCTDARNFRLIARVIRFAGDLP